MTPSFRRIALIGKLGTPEIASSLTELAAFKPLIPNVPQVVAAAQRWLPALTDADFDEL